MSRELLRSEADRLARKSETYGPNILWKQTEYSEILPFAKPLSLSLLRILVGHAGATSMVCRELGLPYHQDIPIDDYLETVYGRTFVNSVAEQRLTQETHPPSFWAKLVVATRMQQAKRSFHLQFNSIVHELETFYQQHQTVSLADLPDPELLDRIKLLLAHLNEQYRTVVKAGVLAQCSLDELAARFPQEQLAPILAINYRSLPGRPDTQPIFAFREALLDRFADYGAEIDYELSCPRFCERRRTIDPIPALMEQPVAVPIHRKTVHQLLSFKIQESLKIIFKTMLLRELFLLRQTLLEYEQRNCRPGDLFYLTFTELLSGHWETFSSRIAKRRAAEAAFKPLEIPSVISLADLANLGRNRATTGLHPLSGLSILARPFTGVAMVCNEGTDLTGADTTRILVVKQARPELATMFGRVQGIIAETGGMLSHLAIVAREQGFPLVVRATGATVQIKNGDRIKVDQRGNITISNQALG